MLPHRALGKIIGQPQKVKAQAPIWAECGMCLLQPQLQIPLVGRIYRDDGINVICLARADQGFACGRANSENVSRFAKLAHTLFAALSP